MNKRTWIRNLWERRDQVYLTLCGLSRVFKVSSHIALGRALEGWTVELNEKSFSMQPPEASTSTPARSAPKPPKPVEDYAYAVVFRSIYLPGDQESVDRCVKELQILLASDGRVETRSDGWMIFHTDERDLVLKAHAFIGLVARTLFLYEGDPADLEM